MTVYYSYLESPVQQLMLTSNGEALTALRMVERRHAPEMTETWKRDDNARPFAETKRQLAAYFNGELTEFDVPLHLPGTAFQQLVWQELQKIPFGQTISYGEMARHIGKPNACRAVGAANGRNPVSIIVPCHRLIGSNGKLTDYGGGLERKAWLLAHERKQSEHCRKTIMQLHIRHATSEDVAALEGLIEASVRALSQGYYTPLQIESSLRYVFGVDTQLVADGTYFVVEAGGRFAGCGGWSRRKNLYGGDKVKTEEDNLLDPKTEPSRIRAFFVHPDFARRGIGRLLLETCEEAARQAGFTSLELAATLPGEPLYAACGFHVIERLEAELPNGVKVPIARMGKAI